MKLFMYYNNNLFLKIKLKKRVKLMYAIFLWVKISI